MIRSRASVLVAFTLVLGACPDDKLVVSNGENPGTGGSVIGMGGTGALAATGGSAGDLGSGSGAVGSGGTTVVPVTGTGGVASGGTTVAPVTGSGGTASGGTTVAPVTGSGGTASGGTTVAPIAGSGGEVQGTGGSVTGTGGTDIPTTGQGGAGTGGSLGLGGGPGTGGVAGAGGTTSPVLGPCDIYAAASPSTPCAAAYSMVRVLSKTYSGPLYQVRSGSSSSNTGSGGTTKDIGAAADGFADTASQDAFCSGSMCTVSLLYDQSGNNNHLKVAPKGRADSGENAAMDDFESSATKGTVMVGGRKVYSLYMNAREGYRLTAVGKNMPVGNTEQGIYMLADGTHSGSACCWEFGNASPDPMKYGVTNALFFGVGYWGKGSGGGPWFMGEFEGGIWAGGSGDASIANSSNPSMKVPFALGILKTSPGKYALRVADLLTASDLTTAYDGFSPKTWANLGGIVLGIGSDNANYSFGTFFEGAITAGRPSNDTDRAVFKNVQMVGYSK
jgi:non-reducing end alpha-L-arabinofuranosidase